MIMTRRATKDTYAYERVGGGEMRRRVRAGSLIPDQWRVEDESAFEPAQAAVERAAAGFEPAARLKRRK